MYNFLSQFKSKEMESHFRTAMLSQDKAQGRAICYLALFLFISINFMEYFYLGENPLLYTAIAGRCIIITLILFAIWMSYRKISTRFFDLIATLMGLVILGFILLGFAIRPYNDYIFFFANMWYVIVIFAVYTVVPFSFHIQTLLALFFTVGFFVICLLTKASYLTQLEWGMFFFIYLFINVYGMFMSIRMNRSRRGQFILFEEERKAKIGLEEAIAEVKVLQGIIPICSSCKKIRDDEGFWKQVEEYIESHSEAKFSHGMCQACMDDTYGDEEWYKRMKDVRREDDG